MNLRTTAFAFLSTVLLGGVTWLLLAHRAPVAALPGTPTVQGGATLGVDIAAPGEVSEMTITAPGMGGFRISRRTELGAWWIEELSEVRGKSGLDAGLGAWPVEESRVRACLQILRDVSRLPVATDGERVGIGGTDVLLTFAQQPVLSNRSDMVLEGGVQFRFAEQGLAGARLIAMNFGTKSRTVRADVGRSAAAFSGGASIFAADSLRAWASPFVLNGLGLEPRVVVVERAGARIELFRVRGMWGMTAPVVAPVDQKMVGAMVARCKQLAASRFFVHGETSDKDAGLTSPAALVRLVHDMPEDTTPRTSGALARSHALTQEIFIGAQADGAGEGYFARASGSISPVGHGVSPGGGVAWGPRVCVLPASAIVELAGDAASLISARTVQVPFADVGSMVVVPDDAGLLGDTPLDPREAGAVLPAKAVSCRRTLDGWKVGLGAAAVEPTQLQQRLIVALGALLCERGASSKLLETGPGSNGVRSLGVVQCGTLGGAAIEVCAVGAIADKVTGTRSLVTRVGKVWRIYVGPEAQGVLALLEEVFPPEG